MAEKSQETGKKRGWSDKLKDWGILEESSKPAPIDNSPTKPISSNAASGSNFITPSPVTTPPISSIGGRMVNQEKRRKSFYAFFKLAGQSKSSRPRFF
jgi:hypothetical protein